MDNDPFNHDLARNRGPGPDSCLLLVSIHLVVLRFIYCLRSLITALDNVADPVMSLDLCILYRVLGHNGS